MMSIRRLKIKMVEKWGSGEEKWGRKWRRKFTIQDLTPFFTNEELTLIDTTKIVCYAFI